MENCNHLCYVYCDRRTYKLCNLVTYKYPPVHFLSLTRMQLIAQMRESEIFYPILSKTESFVTLRYNCTIAEY